MPRSKARRQNICVVPSWWGPKEFQVERCTDVGPHIHVSEVQAVKLGLCRRADFITVGHRRVFRLKLKQLPLRGFNPSPPVPLRRGRIDRRSDKRALPTVKIRAPQKIGRSFYDRYLEGLIRNEKWARGIVDAWGEQTVLRKLIQRKSTGTITPDGAVAKTVRAKERILSGKELDIDV